MNLSIFIFLKDIYVINNVYLFNIIYFMLAGRGFLEGCELMSFILFTCSLFVQLMIHV